MNFFKLQMKVSFYCRDCQTTVYEMVGPQMDVLKAMQGSYSKNKTFKFMGKLVNENVYCPGCKLPVIIIKGLNQGIKGLFKTKMLPAQAVTAS